MPQHDSYIVVFAIIWTHVGTKLVRRSLGLAGSLVRRWPLWSLFFGQILF